MVPSSLCVLQQPKYIQNIASAVRGCAVFDVNTLLWTGERVKYEEVERLPRELRMRAYSHVQVKQTDRPFDIIEQLDLTPVCIDLVDGAEPLPTFVHPLKAAYIFGPEDGTVSQVYRRLCHRFVYIPSKHCLNLAAAMNVVLYDRMVKLESWTHTQMG